MKEYLTESQSVINGAEYSFPPKKYFLTAYLDEPWETNFTLQSPIAEPVKMCMLEESIGSSELVLDPGALPLSLLSPRKGKSSLCSQSTQPQGAGLAYQYSEKLLKSEN